MGLPPLGDVLDGFRRHELVLRASAISFRVLLALIPLLLSLVAATALVAGDSLWADDLAPDIAPHVSVPVFQVLDDTARNALSQQRVFWVTVGAALVLWETSSAVRVVQGSLDEMYGREQRRSFTERAPTSLWLAIASGACVLGAVAALHLLPLVLDGPLGAIVRYLLAAAALWLAVALLLHFGPATDQPPGWVSFGTSLVVGGWLVTWTIYGLYLTHLASPGSVFGAFAAVIILLTFLQLSAGVLLAGALVDSLVREHVTGDRQGK